MFSYALTLLDNHNLLEIWDFDRHPQLQILNGKIFIQLNRKLCLDKIDRLLTMVGQQDVVDDKDVSRINNGDQVACKSSSSSAPSSSPVVVC